MAQLLSNLPIGAKVKFGKYSVNGETAQPITWLVVAKNHTCTPAYPTNSVTLLTQKSVDMRAFDAAEPRNTISHRQTGGNNRYSLSNIDQWLNKSSNAKEWYVAAHGTDQMPTSSYTANFGTGYYERPGFLNAFSEDERNAILETTIRVPVANLDGGGHEDIVRKIYLLSTTEVGYSTDANGGAELEYFTTNSKLCTLTPQAYTYSLCTYKPAATENWGWWLRTIPLTDPSGGYSAISETGVSNWSVSDGRPGVRPALNLSSTFLVSDVIDTDGCYTVVWNSAPPTPTTITAPTTLYGGKSNTLSWSKVTDPDGDTVTYQLECSIDGGDYSQIYSGTSNSYAHLVPFGTKNVVYRVKATDSSNESSAYTNSTTITVVNNNAPVIVNDDNTQTDKNLGVKSEGFTGTYKVTDANSDVVTITEAIDGVQIRSLVATLGQEITYGVTENTWLALPNGSHTLTISATDGMDTTVRRYTFTKLVESFTIQNSTPWVSSTMPTRIMLVVTRNIPSAATFKVEVCNNGYDSSPTWEDCTDAVMSGLVHVFANTTKTATNWGVKFRVTVERNGSTGACYVSAIGGNFE